MIDIIKVSYLDSNIGKETFFLHSVIIKSKYYGDSFLIEKTTKNIIRLNSYDVNRSFIINPHRLATNEGIFMINFLSNDICETFVYKSTGNSFDIEKRIKKEPSFLLIKSLDGPSPTIWWASCLNWNEYVNGCSLENVQKSDSIWKQKKHNYDRIYIGKNEYINAENRIYMIMIFYEPFVSYISKESLFEISDKTNFAIFKDIESTMSPLNLYFAYQGEKHVFSLSSDNPVRPLRRDCKNTKLIMTVKSF